jgi:hypothetical protein
VSVYHLSPMVKNLFQADQDATSKIFDRAHGLIFASLGPSVRSATSVS